MERCPRCQRDVEGNMRFCPGCGRPLGGEAIPDPVCPLCRKSFPEGTLVCDVDGARLVSREKMIPRCIVCGEAYPDGIRFCPKDGGRVVPEALRLMPSSPFDTGRRLGSGEMERLVGREYDTSAGECLRRGWALVRRDPSIYLGFTALALVGTAVLTHLPVAGPLLALASAPLWAGIHAAAFRSLAGREVSFADFFKGFATFLPLVLAGLVTGLFVGAASLLLIVPGVYLAVAYLFTFPLIVDRQIDFWQAMEVSRRVVTRRWTRAFGLAFLLVAVNLAGLLALGVGLLVTLPTTLCALSIAYGEVFGIESEPP